MYGLTTAETGDTRGVYGISASTNGMGVMGRNTGSGGVGVYGWNAATSGTGYGLLVKNDAPNSYSGTFQGAGHGVFISTLSGKTGLVVTGGTKSAGVRTTSGDRLLYTEESSEVWFTDYGTGYLISGYALIPIDPVFAETVSLEEPYHVFLQPYSDTSLYVGKRARDHFEVFAVGGATPDNIEFSYRIVAKRKGYESTRLEQVPGVTPNNDGFIVTPTPLPPEQE